MLTDHPEWAALLRAVCAEPDDDTPRLVAADWLEEQGDPDRAALIRLQIELARLKAAGLGETPEAEALRRKEQAYLEPPSHHGPLWAAQECPELVRFRPREHAANPLDASVEGAEQVVFRRGFVEEVICPAAEWRTHGPAIRDRLPVRVVVLTGCNLLTRDDWYAMMAMDGLVGLETLGLVEAPGGLVEWLRGFLPGTDVSTLPG
jgi:uncharacterized protein (TIGR02996 family)